MRCSSINYQSALVFIKQTNADTTHQSKIGLTTYQRYKTILLKFAERNYMTTALIRQKLYEYIRVADDKKVKAIFTMVEDEIEEYDWTKDKEFIAELDRRSADYKSGKVKGIPWEDAKKQLLATQIKKK